MPVSHLLLMTLYALLISAFFALLWRRESSARWKLFLQLLIGMMVGGILIGWLMYRFPSGPPAPIP
jgi:uncharacterized membrane protein YfcA